MFSKHVEGSRRPIYYAAVSGDVAGTYRRWRDGKRDERQTAATYSGQFFDLCARTGRAGVASFPSDQKEVIRDKSFVVRSRPPNRTVGGFRYYLDQLKRACWLYRDVIRSGADDIIIMDGVALFFLLVPFVWLGRRVFLSIHTVLWRESTPLKPIQRIVRFLDGWFLRSYCAGCLVASPRIGEQLSQLAGRRLKVEMFYPHYDEADFSRFNAPDHRNRPFRVFYAGRIEMEKGVFDLLDVLRSLIREGRDVYCDICGDGAALEQLRMEISGYEMQNTIAAHGHLDRSDMLDLLACAHVVVVPTRSSFPEGLNQVVIEAVLARRPVVTSVICPALELIAPAAVEATADNPESYRNMIARLMDEPILFSDRVKSGATLRQAFFDPGTSWTAIALRFMN